MFDPRFNLSPTLADKCIKCLRGMTGEMRYRIEYLKKHQHWHPVGLPIVVTTS
jgi:hypothetical protein